MNIKSLIIIVIEGADEPHYKQGGAHVIYGLDADLVVLGLAAPVDRIHVARESTDETISIDLVKGIYDNTQE